MRRTIIACVIVALVVGATSATAAKLITGDDIQNGSITGADIKNPTISHKDIKRGTIIKKKLSTAVQEALENQGATGPKGDKGTKGDKGEKGDPGPTLSTGNWGIQNRNNIGSPNISLRSGPSTASFNPPRGSGSLNFLVGAGEKAAFGNEVDFGGRLVANLNNVGFHVYTTGENSGRGNPNMPSITFEIDPNLTATPSNFSSLVFVPATNSPANQWSAYIDATVGSQGFWFLTGAAATATGCNQTTTCTFSAVKTALAAGTGATILTVGVTKGTDFAWQGAVDALRINNTVYDFEETGVVERSPQP